MSPDRVVWIADLRKGYRVNNSPGICGSNLPLKKANIIVYRVPKVPKMPKVPKIEESAFSATQFLFRLIVRKGHSLTLAPFGLSYIRPELMSKAGSKTDLVYRLLGYGTGLCPKAQQGGVIAQTDIRRQGGL